MEKYTQRQNYLVGYASKRSFEGPSSFPSLDFNDVFGGPPSRRFSLQETTRYCSSSDGSVDADETALLCTRLSNEKPVFGGENGSGCSSSLSRRRSHQSSGFYDDIFQGDKSCNSPDRGFLNSLAVEQMIMSPSRCLATKSESLGTSIPAQYSLPATWNKSTNSPTFGSSSSFKNKEVTSNGMYSPNPSLSRFSTQPTQANDDSTDRSSSLSNTESSNVRKSSEIDMRGHSKLTEVPTDISKFHFSMYKWTGEESSSNLNQIEKDNLKRCSSSKERARSNDASDAETCRIVEEDNLVKPKTEVLLEANKIKLKSLRSVLRDDIESLDNDDINVISKLEVAKPTKALSYDGSKNVKKRDEKRSNIKNRSSGVRGKVKDFAKIFNQETYSKSKISYGSTQSTQSCRWERKVASEEVTEASYEMNLLDMNEMPDSFFMVNENIEKQENYDSCNKNDSQFCESIVDGSKVSSNHNGDDLLGSYMVRKSSAAGADSTDLACWMQDLWDDEVKQSDEDVEAEILKWSSAKIGNIRSLLSTLQYVVWAESGWNPVALVDIIEGDAVKKAYQKALLCLHPDKLQQKGATSHQKYIAQKVFDILQEAWDHFNLVGSTI